VDSREKVDELKLRVEREIDMKRNFIVREINLNTPTPLAMQGQVREADWWEKRSNGNW
jgi:hypothetical protein